ncbi:MAG: antitoxin component YwqK of YwqJK toxin-antitoxin module [Planctomycetota bacterium]|jgi:antitoxin component YwqK of YwqJK toxin-antitoxin module
MTKSFCAVVFGLLALTACQTAERQRFVLTEDSVFNSPPPKEEEPQDTTQSSYYAGSKQLRYEREIRIFPGGVVKAHGREAGWFKDGSPEYERFFDLEKPTGIWKTWFRDGAPRSEVNCDPTEQGTTSWWFANGQLSSRGPALAGQKHGAWTHYFENGVKSSEGSYKRGQRNGDWTFWNEAGQITASGRYENGVRVGSWELRSETGAPVIRGE